jgi:hypothetical protein
MAPRRRRRRRSNGCTSPRLYLPRNTRSTALLRKTIWEIVATATNIARTIAQRRKVLASLTCRNSSLFIEAILVLIRLYVVALSTQRTIPGLPGTFWSLSRHT